MSSRLDILAAVAAAAPYLPTNKNSSQDKGSDKSPTSAQNTKIDAANGDGAKVNDDIPHISVKALKPWVCCECSALNPTTDGLCYRCEKKSCGSCLVEKK